MDKIKVGKYLRYLRKNKKRKDGKGFTQNDLADEFSNEGIYISINAINEWENGQTLPSIDNLKILSKIYGKTIDEILDGEDEKEIDYKKEYFIYNDNWMNLVDNPNKLFSIKQEQILKITSRFKELLTIAINRFLSNNEEKEFRFLFENFYKLACCDIESDDSYLMFMYFINRLRLEVRNMSDNEKYWEVQKLFSEKNNIKFSHWRNMQDLITNVEIIQKRFENLEDWQKDMLLAMFQNIEAFDGNPNKYGSSFLERYEMANGEYNHDKIIKEEMKYLIKHGACYNKYFQNYIKKRKEDKRIIDRLEELYNLCLKPITVSINNPGTDKWEIYKVENTKKNRFLNDYYSNLSSFLRFIEPTDYSYSDLQDVYDYFINHDEIDDDTRLRVAKLSGIDTNREMKYWLADYNLRFEYNEKLFIEYKEKEKEIEDGLKEITKFKEMLENGQTTYQIKISEKIGGTNEESIRQFIELRKVNIDYSFYLKTRDKSKTKSLLADLDKLSLEEIKEKYFKMEEVENE